MKLFDPHDHIRVTKNRLPHWQQNGAVYFITFRLGDALPRNLLERWKEERNAWLKWHPLPWSADMEREYHRHFSRRIEEWLDAHHGSCILRRHRCAQEIAAAFHHFDGTRINIVSFVVMPNHVHALFAPMHEWPLEKIVHSWKDNRPCVSTGLPIALVRFGSGITSIGSFGMSSTLPDACGTSGAIRRKRACGLENTFCTRATSREL